MNAEMCECCECANINQLYLSRAEEVAGTSGVSDKNSETNVVERPLSIEEAEERKDKQKMTMMTELR